MLYSIANLKKVHGDRAILDIAELQIRAKKVYTLIGPNGAGKTTLLNILAFLDFPTSGSIHFMGKHTPFSTNDCHELRQKVVLVDQYPILFTGSVWKNIEFGLKIRGVAKKQRLAKIQEVLEMVGMESFYDADAHKLSGGETKRVALARALAIDPKVLLCDEPTANVDTENQEIILKILERCNSEHKMSLIFATHYLSQAQRLADHTIILENGRLSINRRENIFQAYCLDAAAAKSVWKISENLFLHIEMPDSKVPDQARIFIDPSGIEILPENSHPPAATMNTFTGKVTRAEQINGSVKLVVDCGVDVEVTLANVQFKKRRVHVGETVLLRLTADPEIYSV